MSYIGFEPDLFGVAVAVATNHAQRKVEALIRKSYSESDHSSIYSNNFSQV